MFVGYSLDINEKNFFQNDSQEYYYKIGKKEFESMKKRLNTNLDNLDFFENGDKLDGSKMQENWFPIMKVDIFLSHSHRDEKLAIALAGYFKANFGWSVFIDSCLWGYCDDLLRAIDERYCMNPSGETFIYEKRNQSTSHVHMMLSVALQKMIDESECLMFLKTENSLTNLKDAIEEKTLSPWIYMELFSIETVRLSKRRKINFIEPTLKHTLFEQKALAVEYKVKTDGLIVLEGNKINNLRQYKENDKLCLDMLYSTTIPKEKFHERHNRAIFIEGGK